MANMKGAANLRNQSCSGKQSLLPPKCPFPSISPSFGDYGSTAPKGIPKPREGHRHHQRTSSESFLIEEQPSWLDELLNEPDTPVKRGAHRRSSSDSFAFLDVNSVHSNVDNPGQEEYRQRNVGAAPQRRAQEFDRLKDVQRANYYTDMKTVMRTQIRGLDSGMNMGNYQTSAPSPKDKSMNLGLSFVSKELDTLASAFSEMHEQEDFSQDLKGAYEGMEGSQAKQSQSDTDMKRVKQQFAQRSRVRKLQYIAELEKNVQALQAEGMEVSAELDFIDKQYIILNMENKNLKQRLDSLAQEHLIKRLQQETLEREIARLRLLFQQQQPQPPQQLPPRSAPTHSRSNSRDLESQFNNLSLKQKEANSTREPVTGPLRI